MDRMRSTQLDRLRGWFMQHQSVLVAYSGGVDSSLVMAVAHATLGAQALACIGVSPSYPDREMREALKLAESMQVPYRLIDTEEHLDRRYAANDVRRCFFCKDELYGRLREIASNESWGAVVDGTNASDLNDDRPGLDAARQHGVLAPLVELEIAKADVRALARHLALPVWDKPAMACLASRVQRGTPITPALLAQIEAAEDVLFNAGFRQFRVRHHGTVARIELRAADLVAALRHRAVLVDGIRRVGYGHVCLDLAGYRSAEEAADSDPVPLTVEGRP